MRKLQVQNKRMSSRFKVQSSKFLVLSFSFALCAFSFALPCFASDKIVAIVNNDIITQKDLDDFANFMRMQLSRQYNEEGPLEEKVRSLQVDLLKKLIEDKLILQEAKKDNIRVDEARIKARIAEVKSRYDSDAQFQADLARQGLVQADIETKIREQLLIHSILEVKVRSKIVIRPEEVTEFYNKNMKEFMSDEERGLSAVTLEDGSLAKTFLSDLKSGQKMEDLANSQRLTVNKLKISNKEDLLPQIKDAVFMLGIGEVSEPIKVENKYYIFRLDKITASRQQSLSAAQDTIHSILFEKKMQEGLDKWLDELRKHSYVKTMQ